MKKGTGKRKRLLALLAAVIAAAGCLGMASVANASTPQRALSSSSQARKEDRASSKEEGLEAEVKILQKERQLEAKKLLTQRKKAEEGQLQKENKEEVRKLLSKEREDSNLLEASGETTEYASVIGGGQWTGGVVNHDTAAFSTSSAPSPSISFSNSVTLSVSSPLYWIPFYFEGGSMPITSSGTLDVKQVKSWVLSGNFASGAYIGLADLAEDWPRPPTFSMNLIEGPGQNYTSEGNLFYTAQSPLFGGVNPKTGALVSGGISTAPSTYFNKSSSPGNQTFEAYVVSSCISDSSLPDGETADSLLSVPSPSPSSCLAAFQKNAEAEVQIGRASYDLLSYSGLKSLLGVLDYSIPSNSATGYQGPGYQGPVKATVGLSQELMELLNCDPGCSDYLGRPLGGGALSYELDVYEPDSQQIGYVSGEGAKWVFNPSLYTAHFRAITEDGEPLKKIWVSIYMLFNAGNSVSIAPGYWDPDYPDNSILSNYYNQGDPLDSSSPYKYFGWVNAGTTLPLQSSSASSYGIPLNSVSGNLGEFELPKLPDGTYEVKAWGYADNSGSGNGSAYDPSYFTLTLGPKGETITRAPAAFAYSISYGNYGNWTDFDGFVDPSTRTVVMEAHNPFAEVLNSEGEAEESPDISLQYGKEHTFIYQLQTYLPYSAPFSLSFDPGSSYGIDLSDAKVAGIPISDLESHGLTLRGDKVTLNSAAISYIAQNGFMPATYTSPGGKDKLSSQGMGARIFSIEVPTWLTSSFKAGDTVSYSITYSDIPMQEIYDDEAYPGEEISPIVQTITGNLDDEDSNNGWFKAEGEDGEPLTKLAIEYQEFSPSGTSGNIKSLSLSSSSTAPGLFVFPPELLPCQYSVDIYIPEGSDYNFQYQFTSSNGQSYDGLFSLGPTIVGPWNTDDNEANGISFDGVDQLVGDVKATPGFVNSSAQTVVANVPNPSSQLLTSSDMVDASSYPTETVGKNNQFTYQVKTFFSTFPNFSYFDNPPVSPFLSPPVSYTQYIAIGAPAGETVLQDPADISVAGISLSALKTHGASFSFGSAAESEYGGFGCPYGKTDACPDVAIGISLPSSVLSYIASHGYKPATESNSAGTVPLNGSFGQLSVTFKAYLDASQKASESPTDWIFYQYQGSQALQPIDLSSTFSSPQVYTNGPADDFLLPSISGSFPPVSSFSSYTGLWFENTFKNSKKNLCGIDSLLTGSHSPTEFEVQSDSGPDKGKYLSPVENNGAFEGWQWSSAPHNFKERNDKEAFEWGGLADGAYIIKSVEDPSLSFTGTLAYSFPEVLKGRGTVAAIWSSGTDSDKQQAISHHLSFNWYVSAGYLNYSDITYDVAPIGKSSIGSCSMIRSSSTSSSTSPISHLPLTGRGRRNLGTSSTRTVPAPVAIPTLHSSHPHIGEGRISVISSAGMAPSTSPISHLPLTGERILGISLTALFLTILGGGMCICARRRRDGHSLKKRKF